MEEGEEEVEEASPISSRPPAPASLNTEHEVMLTSDSGAGRSGNRWPRQETLALLKIRSDMDASFRDATLKAPLWEHVSRKLAELGYKRSAKKCKEKFENVQKYYKRTKEGRGGRQDGKSYKFFWEMEALQSATTAQSCSQFIGVNSPIPISSFRPSPSIPTFPPPYSSSSAAAAAGVISFSSNSSSSSPSSPQDDDADDMEGEPSSRKRKRDHRHRMMEFFDKLMKQVMQKQEAMQLKFLEIIEKREEERLMREEAWKRQELARLSHEQELTAQQRAMSASRDASIISFLQKITGQTIQTPHNTIHPPLPHQLQQQQQQAQPSEVAAAEQPEFTGRSTTNLEATSSSRWPKAEVFALINLRSGLESMYQEEGPKGPLWEEISVGMNRMGYKRSAKRCKEKWENINKYFKKVKESHKHRPLDAKTCPYFHQLDALYRKKQSQQPQDWNASNAQTCTVAPIPLVQESDNKNPPAATTTTSGFGSLGEGITEAASKKPEDIMKELIQEQQPQVQHLTVDDYDKISEDVDEQEDEDDMEGIEDHEERKMAYKIEFQRHAMEGGNGTSFLAMVQ